jgi:purine-nucleoside phosphorylase
VSLRHALAIVGIFSSFGEFIVLERVYRSGLPACLSHSMCERTRLWITVSHLNVLVRVVECGSLDAETRHSRQVYKGSSDTESTVPCQTVKGHGILSQAQFENSKQSSSSERTIIVDVRHREPRAVACFPANTDHTHTPWQLTRRD